MMNSTLGDIITMDRFKDALYNKESRKMDQGLNLEPQALFQNHQRRGRSKSKGPHGIYDRSRGKSKSKRF
jgi:hypothetical protein